MTRYEIHIPVADQPPRIERVHGDNWLDALRRGLAAAGQPAPARNLGVEFQDDDSVVITDTASGRIYRVVPYLEAGAERPAGASPRRRTTTAPPRSGPPSIEQELADPFAEDDEAPGTGVRPMTLAPRRAARSTGGADPASAAPLLLAGSPETVDYEEAGILESQEMASVRLRPKTVQPPPRHEHPMDRALEEVAGLGHDVLGACELVLDTARAYIPCEAGSILLIDARERCLYFAVARGPAADHLTSHRIPLEVGLAGACIRSRRSINVDDPARDPRFARNIADTVGHQPRSILCAPVMDGRRAFGVLELLDRTGRDGFSDADERLARRAGRRLGRYLAGLLPGRR